MKTKSIKSVKSSGSLVVRGCNYYAFWRVKGKAICKALRDENGAAITTRPEAERAKARLMDIVNKENEVKTLVSIQHAIDDKKTEIATPKAAQNPPLPLSQPMQPGHERIALLRVVHVGHEVACAVQNDSEPFPLGEQVIERGV